MKKTKTTPKPQRVRARARAGALFRALFRVRALIQIRALNQERNQKPKRNPRRNNLAEAFGLRGGNKKLRFSTALGSTREVLAILEVARRWGDVSDAEAAPAARHLDAIAAMTYRLIHR